MEDKGVLITGANGFIGQHLVRALKTAGHRVRGAVRSSTSPNMVGVGDIGPATNWDAALDGIGAVIHLASRVHVMRETASDPLSAFREVNVEGTRRLAEAAIAAGVKRFVFVSSIKVNGERTVGEPFNEDSPPDPQDDYGQSKLEAEETLWRMSGLEVAIVRPPVVYGPGVKGNILRLMSLVSRGIPLPLGSVNNRRSMIGVGNLCDFLGKCVTDHRAAGELFLVSDAEALSTPDLVRKLAIRLNPKAKVWPFPVSILHWSARMVGAGEIAKRLTESLEVDAKKAREVLGWTPPRGVDAQLAEMVAWYKMRADGAE